MLDEGAPGSDADNVSTTDTVDSGAGSSAPRNTTSDAGDAETIALRKKVEALGRAVATLTKEKGTMQTRFQNDKKLVNDSHHADLAQVQAKHASKLHELEEAVTEVTAERDRLKVWAWHCPFLPPFTFYRQYFYCSSFNCHEVQTRQRR